jgi:hypothetical protein
MIGEGSLVNGDANESLGIAVFAHEIAAYQR